MTKIIFLKFVFLPVIIIFGIFFFNIKSYNQKSCMGNINLSVVNCIEISNGENAIICTDKEMIREFNNLIHMVIAEKRYTGVVKREIRNAYIISFQNNNIIEKIHISYPNTVDYVSIFYETEKFSTHSVYELAESEKKYFYQFMEKIFATEFTE